MNAASRTSKIRSFMNKISYFRDRNRRVILKRILKSWNAGTPAITPPEEETDFEILVKKVMARYGIKMPRKTRRYSMNSEARRDPLLE